MWGRHTARHMSCINVLWSQKYTVAGEFQNGVVLGSQLQCCLRCCVSPEVAFLQCKFCRHGRKSHHVPLIDIRFYLNKWMAVPLQSGAWWFLRRNKSRWHGEDYQRKHKSRERDAHRLLVTEEHILGIDIIT